MATGSDGLQVATWSDDVALASRAAVSEMTRSRKRHFVDLAARQTVHWLTTSSVATNTLCLIYGLAQRPESSLKSGSDGNQSRTSSTVRSNRPYRMAGLLGNLLAICAWHLPWSSSE